MGEELEKSLRKMEKAAEAVLHDILNEIDAEPVSNSPLVSYPENHIKKENGYNVGWLTYASREDAEKCAKAARSNADYLSSKGFHYGYSCPGEILETSEGHFRVVIP